MFTTKDIAEALKITDSYVRKIAHNNGIEGRKGTRGRGKTTKFTEDQAREIAKLWDAEEGEEKLEKYLKKRREEEGEEEKEEEKKERGKEVKRGPVQTALSQSYSKMVQRMTEETDWWIDAITKIGHSTVLIAFQEARIPPEKIYEEVKKLKSADEFISRVDEYMSALYEAKYDAESLLEKNKEIKVLTYKVIYLKEAGKELVKRLRVMENMFNFAVSNLDEEGLRKLAILAPMFAGNSIQNQEKEKSTTE